MTSIWECGVDTAGQGIVDAALKLPEPERAQVVQELLDSLSPDAEKLMDDAWAAELDRRLAEFQAGQADAIPWSQLKDQE